MDYIEALMECFKHCPLPITTMYGEAAKKAGMLVYTIAVECKRQKVSHCMRAIMPFVEKTLSEAQSVMQQFKATIAELVLWELCTFETPETIPQLAPSDDFDDEAKKALDIMYGAETLYVLYCKRTKMPCLDPICAGSTLVCASKEDQSGCVRLAVERCHVKPEDLMFYANPIEERFSFLAKLVHYEGVYSFICYSSGKRLQVTGNNMSLPRSLATADRFLRDLDNRRLLRAMTTLQQLRLSTTDFDKKEEYLARAEGEMIYQMASATLIVPSKNEPILGFHTQFDIVYDKPMKDRPYETGPVGYLFTDMLHCNKIHGMFAFTLVQDIASISRMANPLDMYSLNRDTIDFHITSAMLQQLISIWKERKSPLPDIDIQQDLAKRAATKTKEVYEGLQQNLVHQEQLRAYSDGLYISFPIIVKYGDDWHDASFIAYSSPNKKAQQLGSRPFIVALNMNTVSKTVEMTSLLFTDQCEVSNAAYDKDYSLVSKPAMENAQEIAFRALDMVRTQFLFTGDINREWYQKYLDSLSLLVPKEYFRFFEEIGPDTSLIYHFNDPDAKAQRWDNIQTILQDSRTGSHYEPIQELEAIDEVQDRYEPTPHASTSTQTVNTKTRLGRQALSMMSQFSAQITQPLQPESPVQPSSTPPQPSSSGISAFNNALKKRHS